MNLTPFEEDKADTAPTGTLLLVGQLIRNRDGADLQAMEQSILMTKILTSFIKLIDTQVPVIEIITSPGLRDPVHYFWTIKRQLEKIRSCSVNHIHLFQYQEKCMADLKVRISKANGVLFADGDQSKIVSTYKGSELLNLIRHRYINDRLTVAGFNSGAMSLSRTMLYYIQVKNGRDKQSVRVSTGLNLLGNICIDTDVESSERFERMATILADNKSFIAVSIQRNTALIIKKGSQLSALGKRAVIVLRPDKKSSHLSVTMLFDGETLTIPLNKYP